MEFNVGKRAMELVNELMLNESEDKENENQSIRKKPIRLIIVSLVFMILSCIIFVAYMIYDIFIRIIQSEEILELIMCAKGDGDEIQNHNVEKCNQNKNINVWN